MDSALQPQGSTSSSRTTPTVFNIKSAFNKDAKRPDSQLEPLKTPEPSNEVHIGFRKLSYSVYEGVFTNRKRKLLNEINGDFQAGELTAIMGPSGSGKSTLMNILAGYTRRNIEGDLLVNDQVRDEERFRRRSCYIMQDENLQPLLTVMEAMYIAANLKLSYEINAKEKRSKILKILKNLELTDCKRTKTKSLSGGQKKRLAIALELLKDPQVMFFDEPTSGLDSSNTKKIMQLLKDLAAEGRTIICTIHQPSAKIFEMFDHLYAISMGRCIYQGSIKGLLPYLEESSLRCPPYHNPADYLLEVANSEHGYYVDTLEEKSENGLSSDWRKTQRNVISNQTMENAKPLSMFVPFHRSFSNSSRKSQKSDLFDSGYDTSFCYQLYILLRRTFLILSRDTTLTYSRLLTHVSIALFIGILYLGIGQDASNVLNNFNFMFFTAMFLMLTSFNCITTTFPDQLPIVMKEHFNQWYSVGAYYLAITLADIPIQMFATLLYGLTTYLMTSQPLEPNRIILFLVMCILISLVSQSFGLVIGATMDIKNGVIFGPFCLTPFVIFSGFFVQLSKAHPYMQWLFHTSFLKYSFEGLMLSIFGYEREKLPCEREDYCHFVYPKRFLEEVDMAEANYAKSVYFLLSLVLVLRIAALLALSIQIRLRR